MRYFPRGAATPCKAAESAGIREGDEILNINGQAIDRRTVVAALLRNAIAGDEWKVAYRRGGIPPGTVH